MRALHPDYLVGPCCSSVVYVCCAQCCHFFWTVPSVVATVYLLPTVFHVSYVPNVASFFWTVPSVIVNVYLLPTVLHVSYVPNFASFSGYFILDCPFGYL